MHRSPGWVRFLRDRLLSEPLREHIDQLQINDLGQGFGPFGAHRDWVAMSLGISNFMYSKYFRVRSYNAHYIPQTGGAILAANHSGTLPFDGAMLFSDVLRNTAPPRLPRPVSDLFVPTLPFLNILFARTGVVAGSRRNVQLLLESGELLMIFPEGTPGIGKDFSQRYKLQKWRVGHAELAIRYQVPVVPVALVGPEEQMPQLARITFLKVFGAPYIPVPLTPIPLPVRYHIRYGPAIDMASLYSPEDADDPEAIREAALRVKSAVRLLMEKSLEKRRGVFA